jgi:crotonobetainyl-CoA:carnitine CoA-transferase CaiB-like acyl-CoA transferase
MLQGVLNGIRILDLSRLLPGPLATMLMADMGAEVIKIEDPNAPDYTRFMPPQLGAEGVNYLALNRNKKSISLNLKSEEGRNRFYELCKTADVVIDSFRPGVLAKMQLDYDTVKKINPKIIYVAVTGYGQDGAYKNMAGHDINYLAYSGVLGINGKRDEVMMPGIQIADIAGGTYPTIIGCLAAILHRNRTGEGQFVDVAMTDCVLPFLSFYMTETLNSKKTYQRAEHPLAGSLANYNIYKCKDNKWVALGSLEPKFWINFCGAISKPEWIPKMMDENVKTELAALFLTLTRDEWIAKTISADCCIAPIYELDEVEHDVYHQQRNNFVEVEHETLGKIKMINQPIKFSAAPQQQKYAAPPKLGEHNEEYLK